MESAKAAIAGGADAIYLGGKSFSARSSAKNFTDEEIEQLIDYACLRDVKIYIAINTLYNNVEMPKVFAFAQRMYKSGAAAFILQDIGLAHVLKNSLPEIRIHASTQMTVHSTEGAKFMQQAGFSRVVLSRELSMGEISQINQEASIETEVFVHGAMCVSYSGQCLLSSMVGGRSGNRGKCAQPCRLPYDLLRDGNPIKSGYLLSPKDMMTLEILHDITSTGVTALKIEGRMKSPEYVYVTTNAYRQQLNRGPKTDKQEINNVTQVFNRGGSFSTGYYNSHGDISMMSTQTPKSTGVFCGTIVKYENGKCTIRFNEKMVPGDGIEIWTNNSPHVGCGISKSLDKNDRLTVAIDGGIEIGNAVYKSYDKKLSDQLKKIKDEKKTAITGRVQAQIGQPIKLTLESKDVVIESQSKNIVEPAKNAPMGKAEILNPLLKTGDAPFAIEYTHAQIDDNIFVSKSALNEIRRDAIAALQQEIIKNVKRDVQSVELKDATCRPTASTPKFTVQMRDFENLYAIKDHDIARVYVDFNDRNISGILDGSMDCQPEIFLALPHISRNESEKTVKEWVAKLEDANFAGYLVCTYGQLNILQDTKKKVMLDHNFNIFNSWGKSVFDNVAGVTFSQELTAGQLRNLDGQNSEIIIHGRQILMSTHNCPIGLYDAEKNSEYCNKKFAKSAYALRDRKGVLFPIATDCGNCIAHILNSKTLNTAARFGEIKNTGTEYLRLIFRDETADEMNGIIESYISMRVDAVDEATYGHFFRGVE